MYLICFSFSLSLCCLRKLIKISFNVEWSAISTHSQWSCVNHCTIWNARIWLLSDIHLKYTMSRHIQYISVWLHQIFFFSSKFIVHAQIVRNKHTLITQFHRMPSVIWLAKCFFNELIFYTFHKPFYQLKSSPNLLLPQNQMLSKVNECHFFVIQSPFTKRSNLDNFNPWTTKTCFHCFSKQMVWWLSY